MTRTQTTFRARRLTLALVALAIASSALLTAQPAQAVSEYETSGNVTCRASTVTVKLMVYGPKYESAYTLHYLQKWDATTRAWNTVSTTNWSAMQLTKGTVRYDYGRNRAYNDLEQNFRVAGNGYYRVWTYMYLWSADKGYYAGGWNGAFTYHSITNRAHTGATTGWCYAG